MELGRGAEKPPSPCPSSLPLRRTLSDDSTRSRICVQSASRGSNLSLPSMQPILDKGLSSKRRSSLNNVSIDAFNAILALPVFPNNDESHSNLGRNRSFTGMRSALAQIDLGLWIDGNKPGVDKDVVVRGQVIHIQPALSSKADLLSPTLSPIPSPIPSPTLSPTLLPALARSQPEQISILSAESNGITGSTTTTVELNEYTQIPPQTNSEKHVDSQTHTDIHIGQYDEFKSGLSENREENGRLSLSELMMSTADPLSFTDLAYALPKVSVGEHEQKLATTHSDTKTTMNLEDVTTPQSDADRHIQSTHNTTKETQVVGRSLSSSYTNSKLIEALVTPTNNIRSNSQTCVESKQRVRNDNSKLDICTDENVSEKVNVHVPTQPIATTAELAPSNNVFTTDQLESSPVPTSIPSRNMHVNPESPDRVCSSPRSPTVKRDEIVFITPPYPTGTEKTDLSKNSSLANPNTLAGLSREIIGTTSSSTKAMYDSDTVRRSITPLTLPIEPSADFGYLWRRRNIPTKSVDRKAKKEVRTGGKVGRTPSLTDVSKGQMNSSVSSVPLSAVTNTGGRTGTKTNTRPGKNHSNGLSKSKIASQPANRTGESSSASATKNTTASGNASSNGNVNTTRSNGGRRSLLTNDSKTEHSLIPPVPSITNSPVCVPTPLSALSRRKDEDVHTWNKEQESHTYSPTFPSRRCSSSLANIGCEKTDKNARIHPRKDYRKSHSLAYGEQRLYRSDFSDSEDNAKRTDDGNGRVQCIGYTIREHTPVHVKHNDIVRVPYVLYAFKVPSAVTYSSQKGDVRNNVQGPTQYGENNFPAVSSYSANNTRQRIRAKPKQQRFYNGKWSSKYVPFERSKLGLLRSRQTLRAPVDYVDVVDCSEPEAECVHTHVNMGNTSQSEDLCEGVNESNSSFDLIYVNPPVNITEGSSECARIIGDDDPDYSSDVATMETNIIGQVETFYGDAGIRAHDSIYAHMDNYITDAEHGNINMEKRYAMDGGGLERSPASPLAESTTDSILSTSTHKDRDVFCFTDPPQTTNTDTRTSTNAYTMPTSTQPPTHVPVDGDLGMHVYEGGGEKPQPPLNSIVVFRRYSDFVDLTELLYFAPNQALALPPTRLWARILGHRFRRELIEQRALGFQRYLEKLLASGEDVDSVKLFLSHEWILEQRLRKLREEGPKKDCWTVHQKIRLVQQRAAQISSSRGFKLPPLSRKDLGTGMSPRATKRRATAKIKPAPQWRRVRELVLDASYDTSEQKASLSGDELLAGRSLKKTKGPQQTRKVFDVGEVFPRSPLEPQSLNNFHTTKQETKKLD
eukprot:CFRG6640T1